MPLQSVNIPYQSGSVGSIAYDSLYQNNGNHYVWVGGDTGRKFISVRLQSSPNFVFVDTLEISSMTADNPTFTSLYSRAESLSIGAYSNYHIALCKLNSTSAYLKVFTGGVSVNSSQHFILEIDETDDSISITDVTSSMSAYQKGGLYSNSGNNSTTTGQGRCGKYMMYLQDNNIVTLEMIGSETSSSYGGYHFVHRTWDPSTSTLTSKTVVNGNKDDTSMRGYSDFNTDWHHINDYSGTGTTTSTSNEESPTLHGHGDNYQNSYFSGGGHFHMNQCTSRDGDQIHFHLRGRHNYQYTSADDGFNSRTSIDNYSEEFYVITYIKSSNSWTCTSRRYTSVNPPGYYGAWLPINTVLSSDFNPSNSNFKTGQQHADTWLAVDARYVRVLGSTNGGQIYVVDGGATSSLGGNSEAYEAHWLDENHFMIVWSKNESQNNVGTVTNNMGYTVCKYTDENVITVVSSGFLNDSTIQNSNFSFTGSGPVLQKVDNFTYISNQFSHFVCVHAPA
jgi:hypothetical protein